MPKKLPISVVMPQVYEAWAEEKSEVLSELIAQHAKLFQKERNSTILSNFVNQLAGRMTPALVSPATLAVVHALPMQLRQMAFGKAARCGTVEDLKLWLAYIDTEADDFYGVYAATLAKNAGNLQFLLPLVKSVEHKQISFCEAATLGFEEGVRLLLPHVDPQHNESQALVNACTVRIAGEKGHAKIAQLLIPGSDCDAVRKRLWQYADSAAVEFLDHQLSVLQHTTLSNHVDGQVDGEFSTRVRKI